MRESPEVPETLYHYTTAAGLLGIIESRSLWATHVGFLNDSREFAHGISIAGQLIDDVLRKPDDPSTSPEEPPAASGRRLFDGEPVSETGTSSRAEILKHLREELRHAEAREYYIVSLTAKGDDLSQWHAYGGRVRGFAIGFDTESLKKALAAQGFFLRRVVYQPDLQRKLLLDTVESFSGMTDKLRTAVTGSKTDLAKGVIEQMAGLFGGMHVYGHITSLAMVLKHYSFHNEEEWRFYGDPMYVTYLGKEPFVVRFHVGSIGVVPFIALPLQETGPGLSIREIVIGPTPDPRLSADGLRHLIAARRLEGVRIRPSETPYREW